MIIENIATAYNLTKDTPIGDAVSRAFTKAKDKVTVFAKQQQTAALKVVQKQLAPQVATPKVVAQKSVTPQAVTPQVVTQQVVAPQVVMPQVVMPQVVMPQVVIQQPVYVKRNNAPFSRLGNNIRIDGNNNTVIINNKGTCNCQNRKNFLQTRIMQNMMRMISFLMLQLRQLVGMNYNQNYGVDQFNSPLVFNDGYIVG